MPYRFIVIASAAVWIVLGAALWIALVISQVLLSSTQSTQQPPILQPQAARIAMAKKEAVTAMKAAKAKATKEVKAAATEAKATSPMKNKGKKKGKAEEAKDKTTMKAIKTTGQLKELWKGEKSPKAKEAKKTGGKKCR